MNIYLYYEKSLRFPKSSPIILIMREEIPYLVTANSLEELPGYHEWMEEIEKERQAEQNIIAEEPKK